MRINYYVNLFFAIIMTLGCREKVKSTYNIQKNDSGNYDALSDTLVRKETGPKNVKKRSEIINNDVANVPLGEFNFYNKDLSDYFFREYEIDKKSIQNKYTNDTDTVIYIRRGRSFAKFYKSANKVMLDSIDVIDKGFLKLKSGFDIGVDKESFLHFFNISKPVGYQDSISVSDEENTGHISFLFINNKLHRILADWYLD